MGEKGEETNGEERINSSQLAAARHLLLVLKLCQVESVSPSRGVFILHSFSLFRLQTYHGEVIMEGMITGDWLLELPQASLLMYA